MADNFTFASNETSAGRLQIFLCEAGQIPDGTKTLDAYGHLFCCKPEVVSVISHQIAMFALMETTLKDIKQHDIPCSMVAVPVVLKVLEVAQNVGLKGHFNPMRQTGSDAKIIWPLYSAAKELEIAGAVQYQLEDAALGDFLGRANELREWLMTATINDPLKDLLMQLTERMAHAVTGYRFNGAKELERLYAEMLGTIFIKQDIVKEIEPQSDSDTPGPGMIWELLTRLDLLLNYGERVPKLMPWAKAAYGVALNVLGASGYLPSPEEGE